MNSSDGESSLKNQQPEMISVTNKSRDPAPTNSSKHQPKQLPHQLYDAIQTYEFPLSMSEACLEASKNMMTETRQQYKHRIN